MPDITTDVLTIGTAVAGSATATLLSTHDLANMAANRCRWRANTPRARITNRRKVEMLRDLGREVEEAAHFFAIDRDLMGENVFSESLNGEELGPVEVLGQPPPEPD